MEADVEAKKTYALFKLPDGGAVFFGDLDDALNDARLSKSPMVQAALAGLDAARAAAYGPRFDSAVSSATADGEREGKDG